MLVVRNWLRIDPAYRTALKRCGLDTVERVLARTDGEVVAWSRTTDSAFIAAPEGGGGFFIKRYRYPAWRHRLRGMLRGTFFGVDRAQAEARALRTMRRLGVSAVRPVAVGQRRIGGFLAACFLVTEAVPASPNLTTVAQDIAAGRRQVSRRERQQLVERLAQEIRLMHGVGFAHGRLFWRNILLRVGLTGEPDFFLLDPEPPRQLQRLGRASDWWLTELAKLTTSALPFTTRTERLRFARQYFRVRWLTPALKTQLQEIGRLVEQWERHERQRIRMNARFVAWNRQLAGELAARATAGGAA